MLNFILKITNKLFLIFIEFISIHFRNWKKPDFNNVKNKRLLIIRHGGIGDLLFITPIIKKMKIKYPELKITLMTRIMYHSLFNNFPYIDKLVDHAWPNIFSLLTHDYIVFLDKSIEIDKDAREKNVYDLFSEKYFGIKLDNSEKKPVLFVDQYELNKIASSVPFITDGSCLTIGVQIRAGSPIRTPSYDFWVKLIIKLLRDIPNTKIYLITEKNMAFWAEKIKTMVICREPGLTDDIINFGHYSQNIQSLIALIEMLDLIIAPDSSSVHIAAGMDIPTICIYGPFPSRLRIKYYPKAIGLDASAECAPCFTHGHKPCKKAREKGLYWSPCFNNLKTEEIVNKVKLLIKRHKRKRHKQEKLYRLYCHKLPFQKSETSKFRNKILRIVNDLYGDLTTLNGIEIGCGGDPLVKESVCIDLIHPYTKCGNQPIHLKGDGRELYWFGDNVLDYIYSSHLFEDFTEGENLKILKEWARVLKKEGILILLLPDQQRYLAYCKKKNIKPNEHHKIDTFSPVYVENLVKKLTNVQVIKTIKFWDDLDNPDEYNFLVIIKKIGN